MAFHQGLKYENQWLMERKLDERKNNHAEHIGIPTLNLINLIGRFRARSSEE
jgi:hypothetical protein